MFNNFFRTIPDADSSVDFNIHIILAIGLFFVIYLAFRNRFNNKALKLGIFASLIQQIFLYGWYFATQYNLLKEGLPLYHCRIAILGIIVFYFLKNKHLQSFFALLGILGSTLAFAYPVIDPFKFPHLTNFSFALGHYFLMFNSIILLSKNYDLNIKDVSLLTTLVNSTIFLADVVLDANYGFMIKLPDLFSFIPVQGFSAFLFLNFIFIISLNIINKIILTIKEKKKVLN